jgi:predicted PurR-regulated permease PerM
MDKAKREPGETKKKIVQKLRAQKFSRFYLLLLLVITGLLFFNLIKIFLIPVLLASVFTSLFYAFYEWLLKKFGGRKNSAAITCCVILLIGLLVPVYIVADLVYREAIDLFRTAVPKVEEVIDKAKAKFGGEDTGAIDNLKTTTVGKYINFEKLDWQSSLQDVAKNVTNIIAQVINKTSSGAFSVVTDIFITFFTMFYFFRDGDRLLKRLKYLSPLDDVYEEGLIHRFVSVSRATVKGTIFIGAIQGTLGGIALWLCGVGSPILWGVVMVILSIIPLVGAWLVLYPAAIIQLILGNVWQGVTIVIFTIVIVSNVDNLLRPRLVGRDAGMHDLMIFFSTLGGISVFGVMGFIIGPVITVFFLTILDIYSIEFKSTLDLAQKADLVALPEVSPPRKQVSEKE